MIQVTNTMSCDGDDDDVVNAKGTLEHITKVLQTAGMVGGSEDRKDALLHQMCSHSRTIQLQFWLS